MSTPRVKRPFAGASSDPAQRQITSFFDAQPSDSSDAETIRSPPLPAHVASNLLSVGMRVRKSVPEGYKTAGSSAFKLWTDNTIPGTKVSTSHRAPKAAAPRELLPFCGINKVGGLDSQPESTYHSDEDDDVPTLDDVPGLTMSQESADSTDSSNLNVRKRLLDDEEDGVDNVQDSVVGPRTLTPSGVGNARTFAVPRSRVARKAAPQAKQVVDQENMVVDGDFEEADFLVFGEGREMDIS